MKILFTCGGTAGHINPAIALADLFSQRMPGCQVLFVGAVGDGMENTLVPKAGYELRTLNVNSFRRKLNWAGIRHNCKALRNLGRSRKQARALLDEFQPDLVVGTGGFASYPVTREAIKRGVPAAIHESNAVPGLTTQTLAKYADCVMVGFEGLGIHYPHPERVVVTGTPVRPEFYRYSKRQAREMLGYRDNLPVFLSYWGSLGAATMNRQMEEMIAIECQSPPAFRHICGAGRNCAELVASLEKRGIALEDHPNIEVREYIYDMSTVMAAADLVCSRAGASTISELTALVKPSILVPSPNVTGDHQTKNAALLAKVGGAVLIQEGDCTPKKLHGLVLELLQDPKRLTQMGENLAALAPEDPNERIYATLCALAKKRRQ